MMYRLGVDTGGTFTDFILVDEDDWSYETHKTPSIPDDPAQSLIQGLTELAEGAGVETTEFISRISLIVHGTTVATNAVLTGNGAKVALFTTKGFRDALQMRRGMREEALNNKLAAPKPIAPRYLRFGIPERVTLSGTELIPLDHDDVRDAIDVCRREGVEAVAICFLHSYANPQHESDVLKILAEEFPEAYSTASFELLAQIRLYERVSTTALNAYAGPLMQSYLRSLVSKLGDLGFAGDLLIMQSNGGVTSPALATKRPVTSLLSGPAAVPVAGVVYAAAANRASCLTIDMGGTSFDAALVPNGIPAMLRNGGWINRHRVALPMLAIHTIGAGGGSIGHIDGAGILRMGPQSAGAIPGPACYGSGGTAPTCTDANLILGYLNPDNFLGGRIHLNQEMARTAIQIRIADPLGITVEKAAAAMFDVINVNMTEGIREVSVDQGEDPRDFLLVVGGGAGPIHGAVIADELGIPQVLVPKDSAVFAAAGMLLADVRHDAVRALPSRFSDLDPTTLKSCSRELVSEVLGRMRSQGIPDETVSLSGDCDLRYAGQFHEINPSLALSDLLDGNLSTIRMLFDEEHEKLYGWSRPTDDVELVNVRISARAAQPSLKRPTGGSSDKDGVEAARLGRRHAYLPTESVYGEVEVFDGLALPAGGRLRGPAIIELPTTTVLVPTPYEAEVTLYGDFLLTAITDGGD
ncbi:MAG: hydantoinase/oxoprolinase family protein [Acidimicrobiia bacterium]